MRPGEGQLVLVGGGGDVIIARREVRRVVRRLSHAHSFSKTNLPAHDSAHGWTRLYLADLEVDEAVRQVLRRVRDEGGVRPRGDRE